MWVGGAQLLMATAQSTTMFTTLRWPRRAKACSCLVNCWAKPRWETMTNCQKWQNGCKIWLFPKSQWFRSSLFSFFQIKLHQTILSLGPQILSDPWALDSDPWESPGLVVRKSLKAGKVQAKKTYRISKKNVDILGFCWSMLPKLLNFLRSFLVTQVHTPQISPQPMAKKIRMINPAAGAFFSPGTAASLRPGADAALRLAAPGIWEAGLWEPSPGFTNRNG